MTKSLNRREFLHVSASLAAGAGVALTVGHCAAGSAATAAARPAKGHLPRRVLGRTGVEVSILGLGGDGLISDSTDEDAVVRFLTSALDSGIDFFDAAYLYGKDGRCEKNLGLVMGTARRRDMFLATKTGARKYDTAMRQIETSLKRLRTDRLDLVQVHHVNDKDDLKQFAAGSGVLTALRKLQDQKVVRFIGMTGHPDSANVKRALEMYDWDTFMCFVNPAKFSLPALERQMPAARKKNMGIIAMKTFGGRPGLLVGNQEGQADAATLLRYALGQEISVAIPGTATARQMEENLTTARNFKPLSADEIAALATRINAKADGWKR